jgi:hypothetical protein
MASQYTIVKAYCPGDGMDAMSTLALAEEFAQASMSLRKFCRKGCLNSHAPFRFAALHAIELYLAAYLRFHGLDNSELRSTGHRLCDKLKCATNYGLSLGKKTQEHIAELTNKQEYLVVRYDSTLLPRLTQINRLEATRDELAAKVTQIVEAKSGAARNT